VQSAGDYVLAGLFPANKRMGEAILALVSVCNSILTTSSDCTSNNRDQIDQLKVKVIEALVLCESVLPRTELPVMMHILLHVPDCMYRWNAVRNYWPFFGERAMGWLVRHIHNRDLAAENIMTAYCRLRLVLDSPPEAIERILQKLTSEGRSMPYNSMLTITRDLSRIQEGLPGQYAYHVKATRRNSVTKPMRKVDTEHKTMAGCVVRLLDSLKHPRTYRPVQDGKCELLIGGVRINGRLFRQGDHCEYLQKVQARGNLPGIGGLAGSSLSYELGTIELFYTVNMVGGPSPATFVSVKPRPILSKERSMYIIATICQDTSLSKFAHVHTLAHHLIHLDSITAKVKLVPHYDIAKQASLMCGINMWCVR
jgi:hypothetical protein